MRASIEGALLSNVIGGRRSRRAPAFEGGGGLFVNRWEGFGCRYNVESINRERQVAGVLCGCRSGDTQGE